MIDEPTGETPSAAELHEAISGLERRQAELKQRLEEQKPIVARYREKLVLLEGGLWGKRRRWPWILLMVLLVFGGGTVYYLLNKKSALSRTKTLEHQPLVPRVLVTSVPDGAAVSIDGKQVGRAPLLWRTPKGGQIAVTVQAKGFKPATKKLETSSRAGAHWHAVLDPDPDAKDAPGDGHDETPKTPKTPETKHEE